MSVHQKRPGGPWYVKLWAKQPDGTSKRQWFSPGKRTKAEAKAYERELLATRDRNEPVKLAAISTGDYLTLWLRDYAAPRVAYSTLRVYEASVRLYLIPTIGHIPLGKLTPDHIQGALAEMRRKGLSGSSAHQAWAVIHKALKQAVRSGLLYRSPADLVDGPVAARPEPVALSAEELKVFMKAAEASPDRVLVRLALHTGLRRGEICVLRWPDIDLDRGELTVRYALERVKGQGPTLKQPKTERGRRRLALSASMVTMLKEHRNQQVLSRGIRPDAEDWVFDGKRGPISPERAWRAVKDVLRAAGVEQYSLKALRSTHGTLLLTHSDATIDEVSRRLGHADAAITLRRYIGAVSSRERNLAEAFDVALESRTKESIGTPSGTTGGKAAAGGER